MASAAATARGPTTSASASTAATTRGSAASSSEEAASGPGVTEGPLPRWPLTQQRACDLREAADLLTERGDVAGGRAEMASLEVDVSRRS